MHRVQGSSAVNRMNANFSTNLASKQGSSPHSENVPATVRAAPAPPQKPQQPQQQVVAPNRRQLAPDAVGFWSLVISHLAAVSFSRVATSSDFDPYIVGADANDALAPNLINVLNFAARVPNVDVKEVARRMRRQRTAYVGVRREGGGGEKEGKDEVGASGATIFRKS